MLYNVSENRQSAAKFLIVIYHDRNAVQRLNVGGHYCDLSSNA